MRDLEQELRELKERVTGTVGPSPEMAERVFRRTRTRRAITATAGVLMAGALGVASFAGIGALMDFRSQRSTPIGESPIVVFESSKTPWTFEYPSSWNAATSGHAGPEFKVNVLRTTVVNGPMPDEDPGRPNSAGSSGFTSAIGEAGAAVLVERFWVHGDAGAESRGPGAFADDTQNPGWAFRDRRHCEGTLCFDVVEWIGPEASVEDRTAAAAMADSVQLANIERFTESDGERVTLHDEGDLFTVTYPVDWIAAEERINTWVSSPAEILALATYPLRPGGEAVIDAQVPSHAIEDLGPDDIFIWVNDGGDDGPGFPERPGTLSPSRLCGHNFASLCPDPEGRTLDISGIRAWWLRFGDSGRGIYVFVGIGERAYQDPARAQLAWDVVNSLIFLPR
jgi:hypothetical protein